ncbi:MAG: hypothetical protein A3E85_00645 [Gammaproteobacteria bacterium RIFCSPHIGHO2_12_FULL_45_12]|nr:MAG: hypothetical protein A3E85_00645 [Gammaproteobacteria bacterium RIFCSPHIGHO2_12_FULL_45_12]
MRLKFKLSQLLGLTVLLSMSTFAFAMDSTGMADDLPFKGKVPVPFSSGQKLVSLPVTNKQYPIPCPATLICPDINGVYPTGGDSTTCPSICSVTGKDVIDPQDPMHVLSREESVCPTGYAQEGSYGYKSAATQLEQGPPAPFPLASLDQFDQYNTNNQYRCALATEPSPQITTWCAQSDGVGKNVTNDIVVVSSLAARANVMINGGVGQYISAANDRDKQIIYKAGSNCQTTTPYSSRFVVHQEKFINSYKWQMCTARPAGLYIDKTAVVPASAICSHIEPAWLPNNEQSKNNIPNEPDTVGGENQAGGDDAPLPASP